MFLEGDRTKVLCSCEIHYFRIKKENWEKVVDSAIEMGNTMISFYVPWFVHEKTEGFFDFYGEMGEESDLLSWLMLLKRKGVQAILRPGPYIYAEMKNLGLPQWLIEKYPYERMMEIKNGKRVISQIPFAFAHNNPTFLFHVTKWLQEVIKVCKPYIGSNRMITMIQLCNEIPGVDIDDVHPHTLQLANANSCFYEFFRQRYRTIEKFNQAYGLTLKSFEELDPLTMSACKERYKRDHLSYYYEDYYVRYFQTLMKVYTDAGINDVFFLHNAYNPRAISLHLDIKKKIPNLYYGVDNYYSLRSIFDEKSAAYYCEFAPSYALAAFHHAPFVLEHESGYWLDTPMIYGKDLYLFTIWSFLGGFQGVNLFLGHEGTNKGDMGMLATTHEWQAPIREDGSKKPSFYDLQNAYAYQKEHPAISSETRYDMAFAFPFRSGLIWESISEKSEQMNYYLYKCNIHSKVVDFDHDNTTFDKMLYVSDTYMDMDTQKSLLRYVAEGNTCILCGELPQQDTHMQRCTYFMDALEIQNYVVEEYDCWGQSLQSESTKEYFVQDKSCVSHLHSTLPYTVIAKTNTGKHAVIRMNWGKGVLYIMSGTMTCQMKSQCHLMDEILAECGYERQYKSEYFRITIKEYKGITFAYILNPHPFEMRERVSILGTTYEVCIPAYDIKEMIL